MISPEKFYGEVTIPQRRIEALVLKSPASKKVKLPKYLASLLGPSHTWRVFRKQQHAISYTQERRCGLMAFAFEHSGGERSFLVCHPEVFWFRYCQREAKQKCTYEIIQENAHCKLYLDIEFEYAFNEEKTFENGEKMLEVFLFILKEFLAENLEIHCKEEWFLDLDSSTNSKFSRHVILNIPGTMFDNNFIVGNIVKAVCGQIIDRVFDSKESLYGVGYEQLSNLIIADRKGLKKIFVDQGVYTKNRHFRILESTKVNKNAPLVVSRRNKFHPECTQVHGMFLASLITYSEDGDAKIIKFGNPTVVRDKTTERERKLTPISAQTTYDNFIYSIIGPFGKIRQRIDRGTKIQYEIANYRFCGNIGREHKSNNISLVIDTQHLNIYQTCYDPDCKGYMSPKKPLPSELCFSEDNETLMNVAENFVEFDTSLPTMNMSDEDFLMIADATDGIELIH